MQVLNSTSPGQSPLWPARSRTLLATARSLSSYQSHFSPMLLNSATSRRRCPLRVTANQTTEAGKYTLVRDLASYTYTVNEIHHNNSCFHTISKSCDFRARLLAYARRGFVSYISGLRTENPGLDRPPNLEAELPIFARATSSSPWMRRTRPRRRLSGQSTPSADQVIDTTIRHGCIDRPPICIVF
jgi:hypothetical protein